MAARRSGHGGGDAGQASPAPAVRHGRELCPPFLAVSLVPALAARLVLGSCVEPSSTGHAGEGRRRRGTREPWALWGIGCLQLSALLIVTLARRITTGSR